MKKILLGISMISMLESVNVSASSMNADAMKNLSQSEKDRLIAIQMASTNSTPADMGQEADNKTPMQRTEMQERTRMPPKVARLTAKVAETTNLTDAMSNCFGHTFHKDGTDLEDGIDVRIDATVPYEIVRNGSLELGKFIGVVDNHGYRRNVLVEKNGTVWIELGHTNDICLRENPIFFEKYQGSDTLYFYDGEVRGGDCSLVDVSDRVDMGDNRAVYWRDYAKATRID